MQVVCEDETDVCACVCTGQVGESGGIQTGQEQPDE